MHSTCDTQPLLSNTASNSSSNANQRQVFQLFQKLWCHIQRDALNAKYENLDENNRKSFNIRHFFHLVHRLDYFLLFMGIMGSAIYSVNFLLNANLFFRMTASFALQSFVGLCDKQAENTSGFIDEHSWNISLTNLTSKSEWHSFRENIMNKIYLQLLFGTVSSIGILIMHYSFELMAEKQILYIRQLLFRTIIRYKISFFDMPSAKQLNKKLFEDIEKLQLGIGYRLSMLLATCMVVIGGIIMALCANWQLTLIMLLSIPLISFGTQIFFKIYGKETLKEIESYSKASAIAEEVFSSIRTVVSFNGARFEEKRYEQELMNIQWSPIRKGVVLGFVSGWLYFIKYLVYGLGFLSGYLLLHSTKQSDLNLSNIILVVFTFGTCILNISFVTHFLQSSAEALSVAKKILPYLSSTEEFEYTSIERNNDQVNQTKAIDNENDIEFVNVDFNYPARSSTIILKNMSFVARAGKVTAFVGASGSGKSTIISLLLRYYKVTSGQILIDKCPIEQYDLHQLRRSIGVVSQEPFLFSTTIYENIRYGNKTATSEEIYEASKQANAYEFIMSFPKKFDTVVGERGVQISGGEKQRIVLARALVNKPCLLMLDEATSALDTVNEKLVQETLDLASQGRTTIVIAHRLTSIRNAHHIYVMDDGRIIEQGTHDTLMLERGKYYQLFESQLLKTTHADNVLDQQQTQHDIEVENSSLESKDQLNSIESQNKETKNLRLSTERSVFLRLLMMNRSEWPWLLMGYLACIFIGASQSIFALFLSRLIQAFGSCTSDEQNKRIMNFSSWFLLLGIVCLVARLIQFSSFAFSGSKLTRRIRIQVFQSLLRQEIAYFDRSENSSGSICSRLASNASALQQMAGTRLGSLIEAISMIIIATVLGCLFNVQLTLISSIFVIFTFIVVYIHIKSYATLKKEINQTLERADSIVSEAIHNMRTVKQLAIEDLLCQQYSAVIEDVSRVRRKHLLISTIRFAVGWNLPSYLSSVLYAVALKLVESDQLELKNMILVLSFVMFFIQSIQIFLTLSNEIGASLSAAKVFFDLFDRQPTIDNSSIQGKQLTHLHGDIDYDRVSFAYPTRSATRVLNNVCLNIGRGQRIAFVGTSGSGKTTVIQLLQRFYNCTHGQIFVDGMDICQMNIQWIRSQIGLVSQEPVLFDLTIAENIAYGLENISLDKIIEAATQANIHSFIEQLPQSYKTNVGPKGTLLSIGQKQRIAIARAILRRPTILLLDEATSAMDSQNEQIVQQTLEKIQQMDGTRTTIIVAHRLSTVRSCHQIYVFHGGYIIENGDHEELMSQRGLYYSMVMQGQNC